MFENIQLILSIITLVLCATYWTLKYMNWKKDKKNKKK